VTILKEVLCIDAEDSAGKLEVNKIYPVSEIISITNSAGNTRYIYMIDELRPYEWDSRRFITED